MRALVIIDPQIGFDHETIHHIYPKILDLASNFEGKIVIFKFVNQPGSNFVKQLNWDRMMEGDETDLLPGFDQLDATVFTHSTYNCMTPEFSAFIAKQGIDTLYFSGVFTDICILITAMESFDRGLRTFVIKDLIETMHGQQVHEASLYSLDSAIGRRFLVSSTQAQDPDKLEELVSKSVQ